MLAEDDGRRILAHEGRAWIGTPYHPGADLRGVGVDCGMLLVRVFVGAGLAPAFDPQPYPQDWPLHRKDERSLGFVFDCAAEVARLRPRRFLHATSRKLSHAPDALAYQPRPP